MNRLPGILLLLMLLLFFVAIGGCGSSDNDTPAEGIDFLDRIELMGIPVEGREMGPIGSQVEGMRLGNTKRRAIELPSGRAIEIRFPEIPRGARFTCAVGIKTFVQAPPDARFEFVRRIASGAESELGELSIERGAEEAWHPLTIDLDEFAGLELKMRLRTLVGGRAGKLYLANPRMEVPSTATPTRVVLVCIDTLRADHLGCYGYDIPLTPNLDAFAEEAVRFENCETASPWTLPSVAATVTGRYPGLIAADSITENLRDEETTLAEVFSGAGFRTGGITNNIYVSSEVGFFQGVEYQRESPRAPADEQAEAALEWIRDHQDEDFYLYVHLFDPHVPYDPPEPFLSQFRSGHGRFVNEFTKITEYRDGELILTEDEKDQLHGLYNGCVAFSDHGMGMFFDGLKEMGIWDDTALIVFSDHGEEFWEHDGFEHGHCVYEEVTHVPLLAKLPGIEPGVRSDRVSLVDVLPTILGWAEIDAPDGLVGEDLFSDGYSIDEPRKFIIEECIHAIESKACLEGDWKQIVHFDGISDPELYNLADDPHERTDLIASEPEICGRLIGEIIVYSTQTSEGCHLRLYPTLEAPNGLFAVRAAAENGTFNNVSADSMGVIVTESIFDQQLHYQVECSRRQYFALDFMVEPEDAVVTFTVTFSANPEYEFPWYFGASDTPSYSGEITVSMVDRSVAMSYPQARLSDAGGVYIWTVPPSVRMLMENTLSEESLEELRALGYIGR